LGTGQNLETVGTVQSWLSGTDVEKRINEVDEAEQYYEEAKRELSEAKKRLPRSMRN